MEVAAVLSAAVRRREDFAIVAAMLPIDGGVGFFKEKSANEAIAATDRGPRSAQICTAGCELSIAVGHRPSFISPRWRRRDAAAVRR